MSSVAMCSSGLSVLAWRVHAQAEAIIYLYAIHHRATILLFLRPPARFSYSCALRLVPSPSQEWIAEDGWVCHPIGSVVSWSIERWLQHKVSESEPSRYQTVSHPVARWCRPPELVAEQFKEYVRR